MKPVKVVKIGGRLMGAAEKLHDFLADFAALEGPKILVHGGGPKATELSLTLGIEPQMYHGRRITGDEDLEVAVMVYAGLLNKQMVAMLQALGNDALGLTGADAGLIRARKRPVKEVDFGWVGDVEEIRTGKLSQLLACGLVPVFNAITHDGRGQLLNTNADTVAAALAVAMAERMPVELIYVFDKEGVFGDLAQQKPVERLSRTGYQLLKEQNIIRDGMIPKIDNGFYALENGVRKVVIGGEKVLHAASRYTELVL